MSRVFGNKHNQVKNMKKTIQHPISAVILAAGLSSRMNGFKPLMPLGNKTIVEKSIDLFKANGIDDIVVVTGFNAGMLAPVIEKAGALPVMNPEYESGMRFSLQKGIKNIRPQSSGFFLLPVDIPALRPATIQTMVQMFRENDQQIIMPCFEGTPGHPPLIPTRLKKNILGLTNGSTLRDVLFSHSEKIIELAVHDRGILLDADDEEGYRKVCKKWSLLDTPDKEECLSIINTLLPRDDSVRSHLANVSFWALRIANAVRDDVDTNLVIASALLHDICRKEENHAQAGANLIRGIGFESVSHIIAQHMDIQLDGGDNIQEKEIVYFADKICNGHTLDLNYHQRFAQCLKKWPWALNSILKRYENTKCIQTRIESSAKKSIEEILAGQ
ncbi:MAG: NTP transferase domain-containing protein [Desulfobacteraceae bacterium]|nr:NTP transferase domain-containing protein [Desulfobacteraceae bacterium]